MRYPSVAWYSAGASCAVSAPTASPGDFRFDLRCRFAARITPQLQPTQYSVVITLAILALPWLSLSHPHNHLRSCQEVPGWRHSNRDITFAKQLLRLSSPICILSVSSHCTTLQLFLDAHQPPASSWPSLARLVSPPPAATPAHPPRPLPPLHRTGPRPRRHQGGTLLQHRPGMHPVRPHQRDHRASHRPALQRTRDPGADRALPVRQPDEHRRRRLHAAAGR